GDLSAMSAVRQFEALRALHALARKAGERPPIAAALARGYANAAMLTRHLWSDAAMAFSARSLLYAERAVVDTRGSASALRCRAYARMLAGFIDEGSADLDAAEHA